MMRRLILTGITTFFIFCYSSAQLVKGLKIPLRKESKGHDIAGYYQPVNNEIIINGQEDDSTITHFFYDSSFTLKKQYSIVDSSRSVFHKKGKQFFVENICIKNTTLEVYASGDSITIYKLDKEYNEDKKLSSIILGQRYEKEKFVAVMPDEYGCRFLTVSTKKKKAIVYRWLLSTDLMSIKEVDLPKSTLSKEEIKEHDGDFLEVKYKDLFSDVSVNHINKPDVFGFPSESQLFYNDSCIYFVNKTAFEAGINVFKIDTRLGVASSTNYLINKVESGKGSKDLSHPVATLYDTLLIIQNWSLKSFEYHFYNLLTGKLIAKYQTKPDNSLYSLVHSPLKQVGDIISKDEEKQIDNERSFTKRRNAGLLFIKPGLYGDSLVLTFGSLLPTRGIGGMILNMATMGLSSVGDLGFRIAFGSLIPYMTNKRFILLYGHSKFSINGLKPSTTNNTRTPLDDFIDDKKMGDLQSDNSVLINMPGKLYIGIYNKKAGMFDINEYRQKLQ
jgi:hypothetical protein